MQKRILKSLLAAYLLLLAITITSADIQHSAIAVKGFQSDVAFDFSDSIIPIKHGENHFAWGVFNDGDDEINILKLRIQVTAERKRVVSTVADYKDLKVLPSEEISMPFEVNVKANSDGKFGTIKVILDMKHEDGNVFTKEVFQKRVRLPESSDLGIFNGVIVGGGSLFLLVVALYAYSAVVYGSETTAEFIASRGDFSMLTKKRKKN